MKKADEYEFNSRVTVYKSDVAVSISREARWMRKEISKLMICEKQSGSWSPFKGVPIEVW